MTSMQESLYGFISSSSEISSTSLRNMICQALPESLLEPLPDGRIAYKVLSRDDCQKLHEALHAMLIASAAEAVRAGTPIMQYSGKGAGCPPFVSRLLYSIRVLTDMQVVDVEKAAAATFSQRLVDDGMIHRFIEDLLEMGTLEDCKDLFSYIEEQNIEFKGECPNSIKLPLLRACNNLLKRLSKAQDNQMCGRILIFMAKLYPLADKSGVNLHGNINMSLPLPIDDVEDDAVDSCGQPIDSKLYTTLWNLQNVFKNPGQVSNPTVWSKVRSDITAVLDEFSKLPMTVIAGHSFAAALIATAPTCSSGAEGMDVDGALRVGGGGATASTGKGSSTSVKYLSSSKLFGLQLRDATFRRHFLVQCLILTHHMTNPGKSDKAPFGAPDGLDDTRNKILESLSKTEEQGVDFAGAVKKLLQRESAWVAWKNQTCPPFERAPEPATVKVTESSSEATLPVVGAKRRRGATGPAAAAAALRAKYLRMVATPSDQMAGLKTDERKLVPPLREYLQPVIEDMDPESCIDDEYRRKQDKVYTWKCLRAISRSHLEKFAACKDDVEQAVLAVYPDIKEKFDEYRAVQAAKLAAEKKEEEEEAAKMAAAAAVAAAAADAGKDKVEPKEEAMAEVKEEAAAVEAVKTEAAKEEGAK